MPTIIGAAKNAVLGQSPKPPEDVIPADPRPGQVKWLLVRLDDPGKGETIQGQFLAEEYTENLSTQWASIAIPKRRAPHTQWVRGEDEQFRFVAQFWALIYKARTQKDSQMSTGSSNVSGATSTPTRVVGGTAEAPEAYVEDILPVIAQLKTSILPDPLLGRPPRYLFTWGPGIRYEVVVETIGDVRYGELWTDGRFKQVTFSIALRRIWSDEELPGSPTDPSKPPHLSLSKPIVDGDTYESLAFRHYSSALLGVPLRQDATLAFPAAGQRVKLPNASNYTRRRLEPKAYSLSQAEAAKDRRRQRFDELASTVDMPLVLQ